MYKLARFLFTIYCHVFNRFRVYGRENEPQSGAVLLYANHQSMFDVFALNITVKRKITFMAKASLFKIPVIRWFVKKYGAFPVDRDNTDISAIKNSLKTLKNGDVLGIFPEGTRIRNGVAKNGQPLEIKPGFAMIAAKANAVLLPVHIVYKRLFFLFNDIKVYIGKPVNISEYLDGKSQDAYEKSGEKLMKILYSLGENADENI